jgi:hypothetical protein
MIKAVWKQGTIQPLDPVPDYWTDGQRLVIESIDEATEAALGDSWSEAVEHEMTSISEADHEELLAAIQTHRAEQKEYMRQRQLES